MKFIEIIKSHLQNKNIEVEVDPRLFSSIVQNRQNLFPNTSIIPINLYDLWYAVSVIQSRNDKATLRMKLDSKRDILHLIKSGSDLCIKKHEDNDFQKSFSEDFGVGLAVSVGDFFYNINFSTLSKIKRTHGESKPDIKCQTKEGKIIILESKGTINNIPKEILNHALNQKMSVRGDVNLVSLAYLREDSITRVKFLDPPIIPEEDPEYIKRLLMADHYARAFNLIGQKELSKYFFLMKQRIIHDHDFREFNEKEELFNKINRGYVSIKIGSKEFLGNINKLNDHEYIFTGADKQLISLGGFISFVDYDKNIYHEEGKNKFVASPDGICIGVLKEIQFLKEQLKDKKIVNYQEQTTLADLDSMNGIAIEEFFKYKFDNLGFKILKTIKGNVRPDFIGVYNHKKYVVEIKKRIDANSSFVFDQLKSYGDYFPDAKIILICLEKVKYSYLQKIQELIPGLIILDREKVKLILKDKSLSKVLN